MSRDQHRVPPEAQAGNSPRTGRAGARWGLPWNMLGRRIERPAAGLVPAREMDRVERWVNSVYRDATRLETILIASADWRVRRRLRDLLIAEGYVVRETANGEEAVLRAAWERPSLVLLDLELYVMDGWKTARSLQRNLATKDLPLLAISHEASDITRRRLHGAGFRGTLTPPFRNQEVLSAVDQALEPERQRLRTPDTGDGHEPA